MVRSYKNQEVCPGFTLIEVLLALAIIAIAFTALLKTSAQNVTTTARIKEKSMAHWVAMQGVSMVQLGLLPIRPNQELTEKTVMLGQTWYWRVKSLPTAFKSVQQLQIQVSQKEIGPFGDELIAFRFVP